MSETPTSTADCGVRSVKELALNTGFSTPSYFTRAYTASFGHPPSADLS